MVKFFSSFKRSSSSRSFPPLKQEGRWRSDIQRREREDTDKKKRNKKYRLLVLNRISQRLNFVVGVVNTSAVASEPRAGAAETEEATEAAREETALEAALEPEEEAVEVATKEPTEDTANEGVSSHWSARTRLDCCTSQTSKAPVIT